MKIGFVGCGKLGLMVALSIESKGHEVRGYDISSAPAAYLAQRRIPFKELGAKQLLRGTNMRMVGLKELCDWADMLFLAPQTPHDPRFEGITPLPDERVDFDYRYLKSCVQDVDQHLTDRTGPKTCVIISTVLPGTLEREVLPLIGPNFRLVYEPLFIAMGTVSRDFLNPEFVLVGAHDQEAVCQLREFYKTIHDKPLLVTDLRTAEGIKVLYNTFITAKTVLANLYGEMSYRLGMNVDDIYEALELSTDRLISTKYLKAGMGDGGGCHPRDNIALSAIARSCGLSFDFFEALMKAREAHCRFLIEVIKEHQNNLPLHILGRAFKPETNIETGSPSLLLSHLLHEDGIPHCCEDQPPVVPNAPGCFFIGTQHLAFKYYVWPEGSVVIDPFRYLEPQAGVKLVQIGKPEAPKIVVNYQTAHA